MVSFSDKLKAATTSTTSDDNEIATYSTFDDAGVATYSDEFLVETYSEDGDWILSTKYDSTDSYSDGKRYEDENYSYVDEKKNVTVNALQINLTQEENSQYIPFEMFRYYDGIDLMNMSLKIFFVNKNGDYGEKKAINVRYNDTKIRFGFLVPLEATLVAGKLRFEIHATGASPLGGSYTLKTKPNSDIEILESLQGDGNIIIDETWATNVLEEVQEAANTALSASASAQEYASQAQDLNTQTKKEVNSALSEIDTKIEESSTTIADNVKAEMADTYYTREETDEAIADAIENADIDGKLIDYAKTSEVEALVGSSIETAIGDIGGNTVVEYVDSAVASVDVSDQLSSYYTKDEVDTAIANADISEKLNDYYTKDETYTKEEIDDAISNVEVDLTGYATETYVENKENALSASIATNTDNISSLSTAVSDLQEEVNSIDKSPRLTYDVAYNDTEDEDVGENVFVFYEIQNEGTEDEERTAKKKFTITGGSGGGASSSTLKIGYVTTSPVVATADDKVLITYNFTGTDSSGDDVPEGTYTWKIGSKVIATGTATNGENTFDATDYVSIGTQKLTLQIKDDGGSLVTKAWTVQIVDVRIESTFNDTQTYPVGKEVSFSYTPYGAISKTIHFKLDGEELYSITTTSSGIPMSYNIQPKEHGSHLVEVYITAEINNSTIESNHIFKDIIWYDSTSDVPVIGCTSTDLTIKQYDTASIVYTVFDPSTETPTVVLAVDDKEVSTLTLDTNTQTWLYKATDVGSHVLTITCGETVKTINVVVEELDIDVSPVTAGLEFDFNPVGYSNNDANRLWSDGDVTMTVSDNFDWVNGGYQMDDDGDQYFCVKSGTTATINYNLFADDPKKNGKEFKVIFKTTNVKNRSTSFITCMNNNIGLDMQIESANIYSSNDSLYSPYCEDDIIEFEFNINKDTDIPMVLTYEDGVGNRPMIYTSDASFVQTTAQPITIGSDDCDVHIYRMKAYSNSLSDSNILSNFIADARNAEEMINRYNRNQIYDENGSLTPEALAEACPDLRIILVDAPWFTNDKSNKVEGTTITMIYKNGDPILDNWTCTGAKHSGQGTSSNEYGYSGRNLDLIMDGDDALFTLGDGETTSKTITLTRNSTPTDYLNVKVNIASSENQNNAQMTMRFNEYQPYMRTARLKDSKVRDCMEFYNCVVFVRENDEDISTHREFTDTNYHFYSIGNVGDSKKTDDSRANDKNDPKECCIEIMDYNVVLGEFPTGYEDEEGNKAICPESEWKSGNTAYDYLYADYIYKDGEFKSFGSESYEFRYEMKGITEEQRQANIDSWREAYKFVVTSDDETFKSDFSKYFVQDSILYFYLFTERYTMVDNRCKNCFFHRGKVYYSTYEAVAFKEEFGVEIPTEYIDDTQANFNEGYRWDLTWGYDMDTELGIDNTGKLVLTYGKEDVDYYVDGDPTSGYIFRAADSTFFRRIRNLFPTELEAMFVDRENSNAWSSDSLINQWDTAQSQFPEELWRLDIQRKYLRTYQGISIDNSIAGTANSRFLTEMLNGRKKYQRRMFERNQELYFATKYFGNTATQDQIMMRFNNPVGATVKQDFTLYLTPYSDMYIGVKFGNFTPINFRAKAGVEYTIPYDNDTADITLIYGASFIQAIGDLSKCYVGDNDFSKATRLQSLIVGSDVDSYENTFMTKINLGNNKLLEYLDVQNVTGLSSVIDLSECSNLLELHAEGSGATGVIFANGGKLQKAYLPSIISLTAKNLSDIEEFEVESWDNLQTLIAEYVPFLNTYEIVNSADNLAIVRLIGMDWNEDYHLEDSSILNRLLTLRGVGSDGYETSVSALAGNFFAAVVKQKALETYNETWKDLDITYNTLIEQYPVTFVNDDGTILDVQYVDKGGNAVDPITREEAPIATPTKESTVSTDFTFAGWDTGFTNIFAAKTITATYTESVRSYTITYKSKGIVKQTSTGLYGENVPYTGNTPIYTDEESAFRYYWFTGWDKSGIIDGDKVVEAIFDSCLYTDGYFTGKDLSELRPVEIYALTKLAKANKLTLSDYVADKDSISISFGNDYNYDDVESVEVIADGDTKTFDGTNYYETNIALLDEDRDFVLAVDYKMSTDTELNCSLVQCYRSNAVGKIGFRLEYNGGTKVTWGTNSETVDSGNSREMVVIRHKKGETGIHVYSSNLDTDESSYVEISGTTAICPSTLVFGCTKQSDGSYENFAKGEVYWAKLWYGDLGDAACKSLVLWTHEKKTLEMAGFKKFYLSDNPDERCSMTFIATSLMDRKRAMSSASSNSGGWASAPLNSYMNSRMYEAIDPEWRQLIKKVSVASSVGGKSTDISYSDCYLTTPAVIELDKTKTTEPYISEGSTTSYMTTYESRIRYYDDGTVGTYWTRSPNVSYTSYFHICGSDGEVKGGFQSLSTLDGVLIELSI